MKNLDRKIINVFALATVLLVNVMATTLPIGGRTTAEVSDQFDVFFTPAGYVFSIWGIIYLLLIAFVIYQALPKYGDSPYIGSIRYLFAVSCVLNSAWIFAWHYLWIGLSVLIMLGLLVTLCFIYVRLKDSEVKPNRAERILVKLPFSVYLGWISVATIANITIYLYQRGWTGWGITPLNWTFIMMGVATLLGLYFVLALEDNAFGLVLVWAFIGIGVRNARTWNLMLAAVALALIIAGVIVLRLLKERLPKKETEQKNN